MHSFSLLIGKLQIETYTKVNLQEKETDNLIRIEPGSKPPQGWCKINFDASITPSKAIIGFICRDSDGKVLFVGNEEIYQTSILKAEALAALRAVQVATKYKISNLILEGNNLTVINAIQRL